MQFHKYAASGMNSNKMINLQNPTSDTIVNEQLQSSLINKHWTISVLQTWKYWASFSYHNAKKKLLIPRLNTWSWLVQSYKKTKYRWLETNRFLQITDRCKAVKQPKKMYIIKKSGCQEKWSYSQKYTQKMCQQQRNKSDECMMKNDENSWKFPTPQPQLSTDLP